MILSPYFLSTIIGKMLQCVINTNHHIRILDFNQLTDILNTNQINLKFIIYRSKLTAQFYFSAVQNNSKTRGGELHDYMF